MPNCNEYQKMISRLLDEDLSAVEARQLHAHMSDCDSCRRMYDAFSMISGTIADDLEQPPEELAAGIMFQIRNAGAAAPKKKRFRITHYAALAACLAIVILAVSLSDTFRSDTAIAPKAQPISGFSAEADGMPIPMPDTVYVSDDVLDLNAPCAENDDDGSRLYDEESKQSIGTAPDSGGREPEPQASAFESCSNAIAAADLPETLTFRQQTYSRGETVSELPEDAVYAGAISSLFAADTIAAFAPADAAIYTLGETIYIRLAEQAYAVYQRL